MLVYGDPQFATGAGEACAWLRERLQTVASDDLEVLRAMLIQAGQVEQGLADAHGSTAGAASSVLAAQELTDILACTFVARLEGKPEENWQVAAIRSLGGVEAKLQLLGPGRSTTSINLKVPEGFEFYALFPEQYACSARLWISQRQTTASRRALVVGVRGIGTTLSAVVTAVLIGAKWSARRLTVRPGGHPFDRSITLDDAVRPKRGDFALVVDEGPGMSGSSMAAVARALVSAGFERKHLAFFPGHLQEPGPSASPEVRAWWAETPRVVTPLERVRWASRVAAVNHGGEQVNLITLLARETERLCGTRAAIEELNAVGGGLWRGIAYPDEKQWPPCPTRFERAKYLYGVRAGHRVLWKFVGLGGFVEPASTGAELALAKMVRLADGGWGVKPLGISNGFVAMRWIEGTRLTPADASDDMLERIGEYLVCVAGPGFTAVEQERALGRLLDMTGENVLEALGQTAARKATRIGVTAADHPALFTYGDGRLAPHEWVRVPKGEVFKTDAIGHSFDHTLVGRQSILWDLAGAVIEWNLVARRREILISSVVEAGVPVDSRELAFYELAYAAFRLGQTSLCLGFEEAGSREWQRLSAAKAAYLQQVSDHLEAGDSR